MRFRNIMSCVCGVGCAAVIGCNGVRAMDDEFVLDASIDARSLYLGSYDDETTSKALSRSYEVVEAIPGFDKSSPAKLCAFLSSTNSRLDALTDEQRLAFKICLEQLAWGVPGESQSAFGDLRVIALANVLAGYSDSTEDFLRKRKMGEL